MEREALIAEIDRYLHALPARDRETVEVGPFRCYLHRESDFPFLTYARPVAPLAGDLQPSIAEIRELFRRRGRVPRWEWLEDTAPELTVALREAGLPEPECNPLLVLPPGELQVPTTEAQVRFMEARSDLALLAAVQREAFGMDPKELQDTDVDDLSRLVERGARAAAALVDGRCVGGGIHLPLDGVSELAGIGVLPAYQRRGYGAVITAALAHDAMASGCRVPFMTAGDGDIARVYARVGFRHLGTGRATMEAEPTS